MSLNVVSIFESIQGEGYTIGTPSIFIRLKSNGCFYKNGNISCSWCDTIYQKWYINSNRNMDASLLINQINNIKTPNYHIVITGGEPTMVNDINSLINLIRNIPNIIELETNGSTLIPELLNNTNSKIYKLFDSFKENDIINISPKLFSAVGTFKVYDIQGLKMIKNMMDKKGIAINLKFILKNNEDIKEFYNILNNIKNIYNKEHIFITPVSPASSEDKQKILEICKKTGVRYGDRLHINLFGLNPNFDI